MEAVFGAIWQCDVEIRKQISINFVLRALENLDPVVIMLQQEIEAKKLGRDHIFYKCVKNALEFAKKSSNPREQFQQFHDISSGSQLCEKQPCTRSQQDAKSVCG